MGYLNFTLLLDDLPLICLPGNTIKVIGGELSFAPKAEKARDGSAKYFPLWFPVSAESRAVITEKLKLDPQVLSMCREAASAVSSELGFST